jgi:hypothetical protein
VTNIGAEETSARALATGQPCRLGRPCPIRSERDPGSGQPMHELDARSTPVSYWPWSATFFGPAKQRGVAPRRPLPGPGCPGPGSPSRYVPVLFRGGGLVASWPSATVAG